MGGGDVERAYRRYVEQGLAEPVPSPFADAVQGWLLGGDRFAGRIKQLIHELCGANQVQPARRLSGVPLKTVLAAVAEYYRVSPESFRQPRSGQLSRDVAAWLARRLTPCTLRELAEPFGLTHPDSVRNLIRRVDAALSQSRRLRHDVDSIRQRLSKTEYRI